jgi:hypothetical protein
MKPLTHCKRGHAFTAANTYRHPDGTRECRTCRDNRSRSWGGRHRGRVVTPVRDMHRVVDAKRATRFLVYRSVQHDLGDVAILSGPTPHEEIGVIRSFNPWARITACDVRSEYAHRASAYAVDGYAGDVASLLDGGGHRRWSFVNLDLCTNLNDETVRLAVSATRAASAAAIWFSYGRDDVGRFRREASRRWLPPALRRAPAAVAVRLAWLLSRMSDAFAAPPVRGAFWYRGIQMPMIALVLGGDGGTRPVARHVHRRDLPVCALEAYRTFGSQRAARMCAVLPSRLSAWRREHGEPGCEKDRRRTDKPRRSSGWSKDPASRARTRAEIAARHGSFQRGTAMMLAEVEVC